MIVEPFAPPLLPVDLAPAFLGAPYPVVLDSAGGLPDLARYSYLTADPFLVVQGDRQGLRTIEQGHSRPLDGDPFLALRDLLARYRLPRHEGLPPFQGGAAGYWAYELGRAVERLPGRAVEDLPLPRLSIGLYDWVLAHDHQAQQTWLIATGTPGGADRAARRIAWVHERLACPVAPISPEPQPRGGRVAGSTFTRPAYERVVERIKAYIRAGEVYQVNLSQRLQVPLPMEPWALYRRLRAASPAPFAAYLGLGDAAILSASPERFLRLAGRHVETRPIKGTRPRGDTPDADAAQRADLAASPKDRAENLMIVDLLRNDLGRVCRPGTVRVPALFTLEAHPTVWQQVSIVTGELEAGAGALALLRASFPGGSVTGAPKIRAMEIIDELEPVARGVYCGAIGYIAFNGDMDTSIPIRTIVAMGGTAYVNVGGGIVADSDPTAEYAETLAKARGALQALAASA